MKVKNSYFNESHQGHVNPRNLFFTVNLRVLNWNVRRATCSSLAWDIVSRIDPDIATIQEVNCIPDRIRERYSICMKKAVCQHGGEQRFGTAVLVKGEITGHLTFRTSIEWVNNELAFFAGNIVGCAVRVKNSFPIHVVSVYSPAWPVAKARLDGVDTTGVKLLLNKDVWCSEILWCALKSSNINAESWIVAGDFNSSVTFDTLWPGGPHGNQEIIDRMNGIGLTECLYSYNQKLIPTFRNLKGGKVVHQMDHLYVTDHLRAALVRSYVLDNANIFEQSISDHLPIVSEFCFDARF